MSQTTQQKFNWEEATRKIHQYLVDEYGEAPDTRNRAVLKTQSLKKLFEFLEPEQIHELQAGRNMKNKSESFPSLSAGNAGRYITAEEQIKTSYNIDFSKENDGVFNYDMVDKDIQRKGLGDVAVSRIVFSMNHDILYEEIRETFENVFGFVPDFKQPFFFVMEGRATRSESEKKAIRRQHPAWYFKRDPENPEKEPFGWKLRSLDLVGLWSKYAWLNKKSTVASFEDHGEKIHLTEREFEEKTINSIGTGSPVFGIANSKIVIRRWSQEFPPHLTSIKKWDWASNQEWQRQRGFEDIQTINSPTQVLGSS